MPPKIPLSNIEKHSIYASLVVAVTGYVISLFSCDDVFPRFGSVLVCIGVLFSIKDLPNKIDVIKSACQPEIDLMRNTVESITKEHPSGIEMKKQMELSIRKMEAEMNRTIFSQRNRILRIEGSIIIIGTLIWGFGDLFVPNNYLSCL